MRRSARASDLEAWMAARALPLSYRTAVEQIFAPLADAIAECRDRLDRSIIVGLCGPQGSGKSAGAEAIRLLLNAEGLRVAILSLDDLYLTRAERSRLASTVHPLLATRGPPGSHDLTLGTAILHGLENEAQVTLPSFDKAKDDRRPTEQWTPFEGPADIILFEGWCVGARPEPKEALVAPINDLEVELDQNGIWREFVNAALGQYQPLYRRIDFMILLQPPGFEVVVRWRCEQESKLRAQTKKGQAGLHIMNDADVAHFVQHYERLTRHIMREMPSRADAIVELGTERQLLSLAFTNTIRRGSGPILKQTGFN